MAVVLIAAVLIVIVLVSVRLATFSPSEDIVSCESSDSVREYVESFGIETGEMTVDEIIVPYEFSNVYKNYNEVMLSQGFDLEEYKGKTLKRYTFDVLNHPLGKGVFTEVLLYADTVVGADIYSVYYNGFMEGLK